MSKPAKGNKQIRNKFCSLKLVIKSNVYKNKADAEPAKLAITINMIK